MKKQTLFIMVGLWLTVLAGCGQDEVIYGEDAGSREQEEVQGEVQENKPSGTLRDLLEMGDEEVWEEKIEGAEETIRVKAKIKVPDAANLYTMTATKYYLTKEDKKRLAEHFMDKDTIKVDVEGAALKSKESIRQSIAAVERSIENLYEATPVDEKEIASYKESLEFLNGELQSAPSYNDIKEEPGNYSENEYLGRKGNVEYALVFKEDPYAEGSDNICSWILSRQDLETQTGASDANNEKMTEEQACSQAEKICQELGLSNMSVVSVRSYEVFDDGTGHIEYSVVLVRSINGVAVDGTTYQVPESYSKSETTVRPYQQEQIRMTFDDLGLLQIYYDGCMETGEVGDAVKLLSYSQIQEVFRRELETMQTEEGKESTTWMRLELSYLRVADEGAPDLFYYIPVWKLGRNFEESLMTDDNIWINAIDGSRIYPEEVGVVGVYSQW